MYTTLCQVYAVFSWAPVAHTCNPSFLGGWDWEDHGSRTAQANSSQDPISKITIAKWTVGVAQAVACLLFKCKAPSSNSNPIFHPNPAKKKKLFSVILPYRKESASDNRKQMNFCQYVVLCWKPVCSLCAFIYSHLGFLHFRTRNNHDFNCSAASERSNFHFYHW
jgi:hypothetical protein